MKARTRTVPASIRWLPLLCLAGLVGLAGCRKETAPESAPSVDLPRLPEPDVSQREAVTQEAIAAARKAVDAAPRDAEANGRLGMVYHAHALPEAAEVCYRRASLLKPDEFRWWYYLGVIQNERDQERQAEETISQALTLRPSYVPALLALGSLQLERDAVDLARATYQRILEIDPRCAGAHVGLAGVDLKAKHLESAATHLEEALAAAPEAGSVRRALVNVYRLLGKSDEAAALIRGREPNDVRPRSADPLLEQVGELATGSVAEFVRGQEALDRADVATAVKHLEQAVKINPGLVQARLSLATAHIAAAEYDKAEQQCRAVLDSDPTNAEAWYSLGTVYTGQGEDDQAIDAMRKSLQYQPDYVPAHTGLAALLKERGELAEALDHLRQALQMDPRDADAHYNLGMVLRAMNRPDEAIAQLNAALQLRPGFALAHGNLGELLENRQDLAGAIEHYRVAVQADPSYAEAYASLGRVLWVRQRYADSLAVLREGYAKVPQSVKVAGNLAWLLSTCPDDSIRNGAEAVEIVERVCRKETCQDPAMLDVLAAAYAESGRFADAMATMDRVLDLVSQSDSTQLYELMTLRYGIYRSHHPFRMRSE